MKNAKRGILEIYALAVCFVAVVCAAIAAGIAVYDVVEIANPEFALSSYQYERHQSNEAFFRGDCEKKAAGDLAEDEKTRRRLESYQLVVKAEQRDAAQSLIKALIVLLIDAGVFFAHWKLARRSR